MSVAPAALIALAILAIIILVTIAKTYYTVRTFTAGAVERFGKFDRITRPGPHLLLPFA